MRKSDEWSSNEYSELISFRIDWLDLLAVRSSSVQLLVLSGSLWPHGLQHARLPCTSPTPGACSNSCPSSWWCHPAISSSGVPFSSCLPSFPASGSFPVSQLFAAGGQRTELQPQHHSVLFNAIHSNEYSGLVSFRMDWLDLLAAQGTLKSLLQHHNLKASILWHSAYMLR